MAKRGKYQPDRMQPPTRELTGEALELDKARKWLVRDASKSTHWKTVRLVARIGLLQAWKDAGRPE
jgi:hypothetical protein